MARSLSHTPQSFMKNLLHAHSATTPEIQQDPAKSHQSRIVSSKSRPSSRAASARWQSVDQERPIQRRNTFPACPKRQTSSESLSGILYHQTIQTAASSIELEPFPQRNESFESLSRVQQLPRLLQVLAPVNDTFATDRSRYFPALPARSRRGRVHIDR
jgi:hypothetical protein